MGRNLKGYATMKFKCFCKAYRESKDINLIKKYLSYCFQFNVKRIKDIFDTFTVDINIKFYIYNTSYYASCLWAAVNIGNLDLVTFFLEKGCNVDESCSFSITPLHLAAYLSHYEIVKVLIETGKANVNTMNKYKTTPLMWSCDSLEMCKYLISNSNVKMDLKDNCGKNVLHWALQSESYDCFLYLLQQNGNDLNLLFDSNNNDKESAFAKFILSLGFSWELPLESKISTLQKFIVIISHSKKCLALTYDLFGATLSSINDKILKKYFWEKSIINIQNKRVLPFSVYEDYDNYYFWKDDIENKHFYFEKFISILDSTVISKECITSDDLNALNSDIDFYIQSILIYMRILNIHHPQIHRELLCLANCYQRQMSYDKVIDIYVYTLEISVMDTSISIMLNEFYDFFHQNLLYVEFETIFHFFCYFIRKFTNVIKKEVIKKDWEYTTYYNYDDTLVVLSKIFFLLYSLSLKDDNKATSELRDFATKYLIPLNLLTTYGDSILHIILRKIDEYNDSLLFCSFLRFYSSCNGHLNKYNYLNESPLYIAIYCNKNLTTIKTLIQIGCDLTQTTPDTKQILYNYLLELYPNLKFTNNITTLTTLAARTIHTNDIPFIGNIPKSLENFVINLD